MSVEVLYATSALPPGVTVQTSFRLTKNATYRDECQIILDSQDNSWSPAVGEIIDVLEHPGAIRIFAGPIMASNRTVIHGTTLRRHVVTCSDYSALAHRVLAGERVFVNQKLNDIIRTLFDGGAGYGINLTSITAGGGPTIDRLEVDFPTLASCMDELMRLAGGGIWWIDEDKELRYQLGVPESATFTINNSTNWVEGGSLALEQSLEGYANKVVVTASKYELPETTETFTSSHPTLPPNGVRRTWVVAEPLARVPTVTVNGSTQTVGIANVDTGKQWYWSQGSREIEQDEGQTALSSLATLGITYAGVSVAREYVENSSEMTARGVWEKRVDIAQLTTQTDLTQTANALIAELAQPTYILRLAVAKFASQKPKPGDRIDISRTGYQVVSGLMVDQVEFVPIPTGPMEFQRVVVAKKGPRIDDGLKLLKGSGSVSGSISSAGVSGGSAGGGDVIVTISGATGTVTLDHAAGTVFLVQLAGNITLAEPSNKVNGKRLEVSLIQDATGNRAVAMNAWWGNTRDIELTPEWITTLNGIVNAGAFVYRSADSVGPEVL